LQGLGDYQNLQVFRVVLY